MKKIVKLIVIFALVIAAGEILRNLLTEKVTMYNPYGETVKVKIDRIEQYESNGWYTRPVLILYSTDGQSQCVYDDEALEYLHNGWYTEPPVLLYSPTLGQRYVLTSEVQDYLDVGWYEEPVVTLYDAYGESIYVTESEADQYRAAGWYDIAPEREGLELLKSKIQDYLRAQSGDWGVFVQELDTNQYLTINEKPYSSASLIKLFTMAAVYDKLESGELTRDSELDSEMQLMITQSSNSAFNYLTRRLGGGSAISGFNADNSFINELGCTNTNHGSELVDDSGSQVVFKSHNQTSPRDCGRVLSLIYRGELVSAQASAEMLNLLKAQTRTWKIPQALPEGTVTANKTGENDTVNGDAAIVYSPGMDYILCVIGNGDVSDTGVIQEISRITYRWFNE